MNRKYLNVSASELRQASQSSASVPTLAVTPTPEWKGKGRDVERDMETLRASRQDNPFIQQLLASRETLAFYPAPQDEEEDDDSPDDVTTLMTRSEEEALPLEADPSDLDPFSMPETHEHMIRSPPPVHWPPNARSPHHFRVFDFGAGRGEETIQVELEVEEPKSTELKLSPLRKSCKSFRPISDDSVHLMAED